MVLVCTMGLLLIAMVLCWCKVLKGVHILFTHVIPIGQEPSQHKLWRMAESFGATCTTQTDPGVTHVVAGSTGTAKVRQRLVNEAYAVKSYASW